MTQTSTATKGLEGIVATTSAISSIIGTTLTYRGIDINELAAHSTFEEVAYLLWYGELPTQDQLQAFKQDLARNRQLSPQILQDISNYPRDANTMVALRTAISSLAFYDPEAGEMSPDANHDKAVRLLAKFPTVVAAIQRYREGEQPVPPRQDLDEASNFLYMLKGEMPSELDAHVMDVALILHADHELNASTFTARVAASTLSDMHSAVVAAICTLKGPLHGGANEAVMRTLEQIGEVQNVTGYVRQALERKERIMGFGHRVYKEGDPRAKWLKKMSEQLAQAKGDPKWFDMSNRMEEEVTREKGLLPNVDFYSASVYTYLGIPRDLFTPIFAMSRASGWIAHILEQYADNRLIRPRAEYVGPQARRYVPLDQRS
ncbi:MAG TPA: citrate synthase [Chloroflexota bacterium]|nr:citrate synthase [Chloroflexota bacterium]